ncbi:MAG: hypothetical protein IKV54_04405 [Clostridia bacterium]|nr:hypothetical protein [Clostridia bacterium]
MNNDSPNYVELITPQTAKGGFKVVKTLVLISFWLLPVILFFLVATFVHIGVSLVCAFAFITIAQIVKLIVWPYMDIREYEYMVDKGVMYANFVKGKKNRLAQSGKRDLDRSITTKLAEFRVKDCPLIAPYEGEYKEKADKVANKIECYNVGSPDAYCAFFTNDKGEESVLIFEAFNHCLKVMRSFNREAVVMKEMRF